MFRLKLKKLTFIFLATIFFHTFIFSTNISVSNGNAENFLDVPRLRIVEPEEDSLVLVNHFGLPYMRPSLKDSRVHSGSFLGVDSSNISNELVIGLDDSSPENYLKLLDLISAMGGSLEDSISLDSGILAVLADMPIEAISDFRFKAKMQGLVRYVNYKTQFSMDFVPNDVDWDKQWAPTKIEADWAWNTTLGNPSIIVAVVDTGIDYMHPDLKDNYIPLGFDFVNNDTDPMDDNGHGTHCAGIIAAGINNSIGIAGLADVQIIAEKALNEYGVGYDDWLASAIIHAVDQGADIISMSWGGNFYSSLIYDAIIYAYNSGVLLVAAAGNQGWSLEHYPAAHDEVIAVSATDNLDEPSVFTNFAEWIEVAAPGESIYSTYLNKSYAYGSGTSMACPHVAATVALIMGQFPNINTNQVRVQLRRMADDLGYSGYDDFYGYGRVNARKSVEQDIPKDDLLISSWESTRYAEPMEPLNANITVLNFGEDTQTGITIELIIDELVTDSATITFLKSGESAIINFNWSNMQLGIHNITFHILPVIGEDNIENNFVSINTLVRVEKYIHVPQDFSTIKEAINIADTGFKIQVASGLYQEHLVLRKSLELVGDNQQTTIIDGSDIGTVLIAFEASNIKISGFTVQKSSKIWGFYSFGIFLGFVNNSIIRNVTVLENNLGLYTHYCSNNDFYNNSIQNNHGAGFILSSSNSSRLINNTIRNNGAAGVSVEYSTNNTLNFNNLFDNWLNFGVKGDKFFDFIHNIDVSNEVNGKPIYYWISEHEKQVPLDAGYVAVINSTGIQVKNLTLTSNSEGLLLAYAEDCKVRNVNVSGNLYGIWARYSHSNFIEHNIAENNWVAFHIFNSTSNQIINNFVDSSSLVQQSGFTISAGISIDACRNTTISQNIICNHNFGSIHISRSHHNIISENRIFNDQFFGVGIYGESSGNSLINNRVEMNSIGIWIKASANSDSTVYHNNFINNSIQADITNSTFYRWDNGLEGNYWSDYENLYPNAEEVNGLGIWDTPYFINENNLDNYPLTNLYWCPYDVNRDLTIGIDDIVKVAEAFGSYSGHPRWIPTFDVNDDSQVDIIDIITVASHFGESA